jgi:hypothetical protein
MEIHSVVLISARWRFTGELNLVSFSQKTCNDL